MFLYRKPDENPKSNFRKSVHNFLDRKHFKIKIAGNLREDALKLLEVTQEKELLDEMPEKI